jgi:hypothetical protein
VVKSFKGVTTDQEEREEQRKRKKNLDNLANPANLDNRYSGSLWSMTKSARRAPRSLGPIFESRLANALWHNVAIVF